AAVGAGFVTSVRTASDLRRLVTTKDFVTLTDAVPSVESALLRAAGAAESGYRMGPPGKAVRPTGRTCSYGWEGQLAVRVGRLGRPQSPTKGVIIRRPRQLQEVARSTWPEGSTVVTGFGRVTSRRSLGPSTFTRA